jgi:integrase
MSPAAGLARFGRAVDASHSNHEVLSADNLGRAGLRYRKPHALRHTFASLLLENRESPVHVKEQMGHSSIKITVDTYGT